MGRPIERLQKWYRGIMDRLLNHKAMVMGFSVLVLVLTVILASGMQTELMTSDDTGTVSVSIETRPGLKQEKDRGGAGRSGGDCFRERPG